MAKENDIFIKFGVASSYGQTDSNNEMNITENNWNEFQGLQQ